MDDLPAWILNAVVNAVDTNPWLGYGAIATAMLLENVIPPVPSEVLLPMAGYLVWRGQLLLVPTVAAALLGTVTGAWFWYWIGRLVHPRRLEQWLQRHGRRLGLVVDDLARSRRWFLRHGAALVFWGRMVPGLRTLISVPAGLERMPQPVFLAWTTAGSLIWTTALILVGRALGEGYRRVQPWLEPYAQALKLALVAALGLGVLVLLLRAVRAGRQPG
ncbi:alkaline phosphatase like protein [Cyanobium sp. PCC 7001]|uniref:DedA family protein n=1 Tax=Cyanobium sp. PCC 7001 TaxID=180281 RepID=UPI0001805154|nr:DedA family protein [Cyanobium sp. PCC 7001]EDY39133.1 alkaline phosphatase like protein [Cyanobium sp. PCC 7001]